ncbi:Crp/Fnr family transcriptional regulator [Streptomyces sp. NPDC058653]|uniref:Crp/Fnr family transcriptional regulator n=1 Tax=Streptomyces sp. NPDC058653 TaxID=3346576 RepID=UPI00365D750C
MTRVPRLLKALPAQGRDRLMGVAREVNFPAGTRIFEEDFRADRFWVVRTGSVELDLHVPGRRASTVEMLGPGDLLGCSWLFPPHTWKLGAEAVSPVRALKFDAADVRALCEEDPRLGQALAVYVAETVAQRLQAARSRLLNQYGPAGGDSLGAAR